MPGGFFAAIQNLAQPGAEVLHYLPDAVRNLASPSPEFLRDRDTRRKLARHRGGPDFEEDFWWGAYDRTRLTHSAPTVP
ncbi:MAG TPA: hypothetical protein VKV02_12490 [Acidobacteriaceae bacterium]|nr:hypothetical protein [Acidobacteriaceae bacterium]